MVAMVIMDMGPKIKFELQFKLRPKYHCFGRLGRLLWNFPKLDPLPPPPSPTPLPLKFLHILANNFFWVSANPDFPYQKKIGHPSSLRGGGAGVAKILIFSWKNLFFYRRLPKAVHFELSRSNNHNHDSLLSFADVYRPSADFYRLSAEFYRLSADFYRLSTDSLLNSTGRKRFAFNRNLAKIHHSTLMSQFKFLYNAMFMFDFCWPEFNISCDKSCQREDECRKRLKGGIILYQYITLKSNFCTWSRNAKNRFHQFCRNNIRKGQNNNKKNQASTHTWTWISENSPKNVNLF